MATDATAIKAVYADFGMTLAKPIFPPEEGMLNSLIDGAERANVLEECGGKTRLELVYQQVMEKFGGGMKAVKKIGEEEMFYLCDAAYGILEPTGCERATICFMGEEVKALHPVEGVECFRDFLNNKIRTGIITDGKHYQMILQWLDKYNLQDHFLDIYTRVGKLDYTRAFTKEFDATKEDGRLLSELGADLQELGVAPGETVVVDDSPRNCAKAHEKGFKSVVYTGVIKQEMPTGCIENVDAVIRNFKELPLVISRF
jgi:phosphoglycolate phosphatase-like HAD superfamily hydrolase